MNRRPELLVPASSLEVLKTAVIFGADAVYIGGEAFGLRAKAKNFSRSDMEEGIAFAHAHGFDLRALELNAGFPSLQNEIIVPGAFILGDNLMPLFLTRHAFPSVLSSAPSL